MTLWVKSSYSRAQTYFLHLFLLIPGIWIRHMYKFIILSVGVWLWLLFKVLFIQKSMPIIFFLFFKNYFWDQHIKMIWKHQKHVDSKQKKKNSNFFGRAFRTHYQTILVVLKINKLIFLVVLEFIPSFYDFNKLIIKSIMNAKYKNYIYIYIYIYIVFFWYFQDHAMYFFIYIFSVNMIFGKTWS
jgi:hypothetical protein